MNIVVYNIASGEIMRSVTATENMVPLQYDHELENYIEHDQVDDALFYIVSGAITFRPEFQETISGTTITGLPDPTTVVTNGTATLVTDGEADLTFEQAGTYLVQLYSFPYVEKTVEVTQP